MKTEDSGLVPARSGRRLHGWAKALLGGLLAAGLVLPAAASADIIGSDTFEGLTLEPFTAASGAVDLGQGGLAWTRDVRSGTPREWTFDNSLMAPSIDPNSAPGYYGWSAWSFDAWNTEQGGQGRGSACPDLAVAGNTCLVADPDAMDDFQECDPDLYDGAALRSYQLTGDLSQTSIEMKYEFRNEDLQEGWIEVSFDGGTTWQLLQKLGPADSAPSEYEFGCPATFSVANGDFTADSTDMTLRFRMKGGNDWWFAVDDILVTTDTFSDFEDFEGLTLEPFVVAVGDGTDWTNQIPNWTIDNSNNLGMSLELGYDGWTAMDCQSWVDEQGGQGRTFFNIIDPNNTVLVADGDAFYDYDVDLMGNPPAPPEGLNTYISREYPVGGFDANTLVISFEYEFRIENQQLGVAEISFDQGATWIRLLELDDNDGANDDQLGDLAVYTAGVDFTAVQSATMILRFGYLNADNNWWFAIDNVTVEGDPLPISVPDTFNIVNGVSAGGGLNQLLASDNNDARISRDPFGLQPRVLYEVEGTSPQASPASIDFTIEESVFARGDVSRTIQLFNYDTATYEDVDTRNSSRLGDRTDVINVTGANLGRFVENGTSRIKARVRYDGPVARAAFTCNVDNIFWSIN